MNDSQKLNEPPVVYKCHSSYLYTALVPKRATKAVKIISQIIDKTITRSSFDAVAFMGMSGSLIAPSLCRVLKKDMIMVRKDNDDSNSGMKAEGALEAEKIIIVDDFVCCGITISKLLSKLIEIRKLYSETSLQVKALFLYHDYSSWSDKGVSAFITSTYPEVQKLLEGVPTYGFRMSDTGGVPHLFCSDPVQRALKLKEDQQIKL
jgi:orotate phosphoribosyltransferase